MDIHSPLSFAQQPGPTFGASPSGVSCVYGQSASDGYSRRRDW